MSEPRESDFEAVVEALRALEKELQCPICLSTVEDAHSLPCNHQFCRECVRRALRESKQQCPLCNVPVFVRDVKKNNSLANIAAAFAVLDEQFQLIIPRAAFGEPVVLPRGPQPDDFKRDTTNAKESGTSSGRNGSAGTSAGEEHTGRAVTDENGKANKAFVLRTSPPKLDRLTAMMSRGDLKRPRPSAGASVPRPKRRRCSEESGGSITPAPLGSFFRSQSLPQVADDSRRFVVLQTSLNADEQMTIRDVCKRLCGRMVQSYVPQVTHLVVPSSHDNLARRTQKFLECVAAGSWIVSFDLTGIMSCLRRNQWVPEKEYEVHGDTNTSVSGGPLRSRVLREKGKKVFDGYHIHLFGQLSPPTPVFRRIAMLAGATVREIDLSEEFDAEFTVVVADVKARRLGEYEKHNIPIVHSDWLKESIASCSILPLEEYQQ